MEDSTLCVIEGCTNKPSRKRLTTGGRCSAHYAEHRKATAPKCSIAECKKPMHKRTWCATHYSRWRRLGKVHPLSRDLTRPTEATCAACERVFSLARRDDGRLQRTDTKWCRDCRRSRSEARRYLFYGVTQKWYANQVARGCSICGATDRTFHVDHNHECCPGKQSCGKCVRGLLCSQCNHAPGLFGDSTQVLRKAIEYLKN